MYYSIMVCGTGMIWQVYEHFGMNLYILVHAGIYWYILVYTGIYWHCTEWQGNALLQRYWQHHSRRQHKKVEYTWMKWYQAVAGGTKALYGLIQLHSGVLDFLILPPTASHCDVASNTLAGQNSVNHSISYQSTYHNVTVHTSTYKCIPLHTRTYQYILVHTSMYYICTSAYLE